MEEERGVLKIGEVIVGICSCILKSFISSYHHNTAVSQLAIQETTSFPETTESRSPALELIIIIIIS